MSNAINVAIVVEPTTVNNITVYSAWVATSVVDGQPIADTGYRFGYMAGETGAAARKNLKDHLAAYPCEFRYVTIEELRKITGGRYDQQTFN